MCIGQIIDIADSEARASPAGVAAVSRIVGKTDTGAQIRIAIGVGAVAEIINVLETMFSIIVIIGGIPNSGATNRSAPTTAVFTSDEKHIIQIARIGHGVLLIFQSLIEHGCHLGNGLSRETAVEHIDKLVAVNT